MARNQSRRAGGEEVKREVCTPRAAGLLGVAVGVAIIFVLGPLAPPVTAAELPESIAVCLACHGPDAAPLGFEDGSELALSVDPAVFTASVHGTQLKCTDCHEKYDGEGHPSGAKFANHRAYTLASYEMCKKCHFETYTRTLESAHFEGLKKGNQAVPVCADCHGAHDIQEPHEKRSMMSRSCGRCHIEIYHEYGKSVHGKALLQDGVQDVPACADCHTAHSNEDPRTARFRLASPHICIGCHGDAQRMAPFGIPTTVATTYLSDFHGVTATLAQPEKVTERQLVVTCIDCHGVHSIASPKLIGAEGMKATVRHVCESCHKGAATDFPAAWLSHYQPSLKHAPLVYLVNLMYQIVIPFMVVGLVLQVLLHLYRVAIRR